LIAGEVSLSMRITFVLPDAGLAGGVRVVATYAERLHKKGHQVCVVCRPPQPISLGQQCRSLLRGRGWLVADPSPHFDGKSISPRLIKRWRPIVASDVPNADVVVATWWETAEWVAQFPASKGAKVYFIQHDETLFPGQPRERVKATWRLPMQKIVVSQWLADLARSEYGDADATLVPNSVDGKQFFASFRSKQPVPTVGLMYSEVDWKGCDISLKAFSLAARRVPNLQLVAFGVTPPSPALPLPPGTKYACRPPQSALKDIYAQCDVWLFGSRSEGFGLPILEAMACRTPVIGTPVGAAPELLAHNAGILVKPEDPEDMARGIEQICQMTNSEWQVMSQLAYTRATGYTWDNATDLLEAALFRAVEPVQTKKLIQDLV
jgi:glycosyltransferase involved in cell wall biosynthesis